MLLNMRHRCKTCDRSHLKNSMLRHMAILHGFIEEAIALKVKNEKRLVSDKTLYDIVAKINLVEKKLYSCNMDTATTKQIDCILQLIRRARKDLQPIVFGTVRLDRFGSKWPVSDISLNRHGSGGACTLKAAPKRKRPVISKKKKKKTVKHHAKRMKK